MRVSFELYLAFRYLRLHRGRAFLSIITLISVLGVTVGTAALVIALSLMTGFEQDVRQRILRAGAHLTVVHATDAEFDDHETLAGNVTALPGVAAAGPVLHTPAMITHEHLGGTAYVELHGVDPIRHREVIDLGESGSDPLKPLLTATGEGRSGIVLGVDLAERLLAAPGDRVRVLVPRIRLTPFAPLPRSRVLEVVGTFETGDYPQDLQRAYVTLPDAQQVLDAGGRASWLEVRLEDIDELDKRKGEIAGALGASWIVVDLIEQNQEILKALNTEKLMLFLAIGLIVIVASLNIVSTLILIVADKIKEIGTLSALGARPAGIARVFILQGVVIGLVGTVAGLVLGFAVSYWLDAYEIFRLDPDVYYIAHVPFAPRVTDMTMVAALVMTLSFVATIYPAFRAATLDPVEAIRHE